jgi:MFS family permease
MPSQSPQERPQPSESSWALLKNRNFRWLLTANNLWWLTFGFESPVIGWLALDLTDSPGHVALLGFFRSALVPVVGLFAGLICDRIGRKRAMVASQCVGLAAATTLAVILWLDALEFWHLAVVSLASGGSWTLGWTARRSLLPDVVGKSRTVDGLLFDNFSQTISLTLGPIAGGAVMELAGTQAAYTVLVGIAAFAVIAVLRVAVARSEHEENHQDATPWGHMADSIRYVRKTPSILGAFLITVALNLFAFPCMVLLPVFARDIFRQGPIGLGVLSGADGIGALLGLLVIVWMRRSLPHGWIFIFGSMLLPMTLIAFSACGSFPLAVVVLVFSGVARALFSVMQNSIVLLTASDEMRSRAVGAIVLAIGAGPPGRLQIGALANAFGSPVAVGISAAVAALATIVIAALVPGLRRAGPPGEHRED